MLLMFHCIDAFDQVDIVLHQTRVVLTVLRQVPRQLLAVVADMSLVSIPLSCLLSVLINSRRLFAICLLFDPGFVQTNNSLL